RRGRSLRQGAGAGCLPGGDHRGARRDRSTVRRRRPSAYPGDGHCSRSAGRGAGRSGRAHHDRAAPGCEPGPRGVHLDARRAGVAARGSGPHQRLASRDRTRGECNRAGDGAARASTGQHQPAARTRRAGGTARLAGGSVNLTHLDAEGRARMVDVGGKPVTARRAVATGEVRMSRQAFELVEDAARAKGDVLTTAEIAAVMAGKRTSELVPLCHQVPLDRLTVVAEPVAEWPGVRVTATVNATARTGVEMEALVAVSIGCCTV